LDYLHGGELSLARLQRELVVDFHGHGDSLKLLFSLFWDLMRNRERRPGRLESHDSRIVSAGVPGRNVVLIDPVDSFSSRTALSLK